MCALRSIKQLLQDAESSLIVSDTARLDAELLLQKILACSRSYLFSHSDERVQQEDAEVFESVIKKRSAGEPIAYILGTQAFWDLDLKVTPATLIPRADTETVVECALDHIPKQANWNIADLGTGSGAIAIALAKERPACTVLATDICEQALSIAVENAHTYRLHNIRFQHSDWFNRIEQKHFHMIVSNPPYIAANDPHLQGLGVRFEPTQALIAGTDGLNAIRQIAQQAQEYLYAGGYLILEHGYHQGMQVADILTEYGYNSINPRYDLAGHHRASYGIKQHG